MEGRFVKVLEGKGVKLGHPLPANKVTAKTHFRSDNSFAIFNDEDEDENPSSDDTNSDKLLGGDGQSLDLLLNRSTDQDNKYQKTIALQHYLQQYCKVSTKNTEKE